MSDNQLFKNLKALEDASFPKRCDNCGLEYENEKAYIQQTVAYQQKSGLSEAEDQTGGKFVKLIRCCPCGQPILDHFSNRRDDSAKGEIRRKAFEKVIVTLIEKGVAREAARRELLNYMNNKGSKLLESLGIFSNR